MHYPKISIITPSYNQDKFIEKTIKSVLSQNYPNLEYIIVDGGSTDNTLKILKKYDKRINWISEKDHGQTDAINKGFKIATGDIIAYLNSDDYYLPGTLKRIAKIFIANKKIKWLTGDYIIIDENDIKIQNIVVFYKKILRLFPYLPILLITNFIAQPSTFIRRAIINELGFFDQSLDYVMDYDYWIKIIKNNPLYVINSPLAAFRIHRTSKSGIQYKQQFNEELKIVKKYSKNKFVLFCHRLHNWLIVKIYDLLKNKL